VPKPFLNLSLDQFAELIEQFPWRRNITEVHVHHTFRPNHDDFALRPPIQTIEGMWRFHTQERGFSDIAQHITIDPTGMIWTGRDWNTPPASATGFNGNSAKGPFMFEMIGDFDKDRDTWKDPQRSVAIEVIARVQKIFNLEAEAFRFHNAMSTKTCPGSAIKREDVLAAVQEVQARMAGGRSPRGGVSAARAAQTRATTARLLEMLSISPPVRSTVSGTDSGECGPNFRDPSDIAPPTFRDGSSRELSPDDRAVLRRHVVNLRMGALSSGGDMQTTEADIEALFSEHLAEYMDARKKAGDKLRLVFFAHGGLNAEAAALASARRRIAFYLENNCYPIFFVWETGPKETLVDLLRDMIGLAPSRGITDTLTDLSDSGLEVAFRNGGFSMWANMKLSAERAFLPRQGGTFLVRKLTEFWARNNANMEIHAIGHSAGTIFHAYFLDLLTQQPVTPKIEVKSLHFLAPAITNDLFKDKVLPLVGKQLKSFTQFTMKKDFELSDSIGPYRKSLLYLVSRSLEDRPEMPILGLEESLRRDPDMIRFFGLVGNKKGPGELLFSVQEAGVSTSTIARKHGDFDNDRFTMAGVMRRILGRADNEEIVEFPETVSRTVLDLTRAEVAGPGLAAAAAPMVAGPVIDAVSASGSKRALCIGIDLYPAPNRLAGCVNDANDWAATLRQLGFEVDMLTDEQASWKAILSNVEGLLAGARSGDVIVLQYAGHGTLLDDLDGDENGGKDSALCPVDFSTGRFVIDDDLRKIFRKLAAGVNFTCFFDCCHSGTITRLAAIRPPGAIGEDVRARFINSTGEMEQAHAQFRAALASDPVQTRGPVDMAEVSFTACTDAQVALEMSGHGQFTTHALPVLRQGSGSLTNEQFFNAVTSAFGSAATTQTPQLDCAPAAKSRPLLASLFDSSRVSATPHSVSSRLDAIERRLSRLGV